MLTWAYGYLVFLKLDALGPITSAFVGWLVFLTFLMAERIGTFLEHPFVDARFALPMDRFCALISLDLLGASDPLAQPSPTKGPWLR
jgi:putative membrane protein